MENFQFVDEEDFNEVLPLQASNRPVHLKVHDIMSEEEIRIYCEDNLSVALQIMQWEGLLHSCVFDNKHKLIGIINYEDLIKNKDNNLKVKDLMHYNFHKIYGELDADIGKEAIIKEPDHCMPVFENKKIVGILTIENFFSPSDWN